MTPFEHSTQVINTVREKTDRVILLYSTGKDSLVLLDLLAKKFKEVICVYMYMVKDLEHIDKYLRFAENRYKNVRVVQKPHWRLTHIHSYGVYCKPQKVKILRLRDIVEIVKIEFGCQYVFIGEKKVDSFHRRGRIAAYDNCISKVGLVCALAEWKDTHVYKYIERNKLPLPIRYSSRRTNGVRFDLDVYLFLRENYPNDLKKILEAYPLSEKILFDYDQKNKNS